MDGPGNLQPTSGLNLLGHMVFRDGYVRSPDKKGPIPRILDVHGDRHGRRGQDTEPTGGHFERQNMEPDEGLLDVEAVKEANNTGRN